MNFIISIVAFPQISTGAHPSHNQQALQNHCQSLPVSRREQLELAGPKGQPSCVHAPPVFKQCSALCGMETMLRYAFYRKHHLAQL